MEHTPEGGRLVEYEQALLVAERILVPAARRKLHGRDPDLHGGAYLLGSAQAYRHFVGNLQRARIREPSSPTIGWRPSIRFRRRSMTEAAIEASSPRARQPDRHRRRLGRRWVGARTAIRCASRRCRRARVAPVAPSFMSPWADLALTGGSMAERAERIPW